MARSFEVGDRVRARCPSYVPTGMRGCVCKKVIRVAGMYVVQFDGFDCQILLHADELEPVTDDVADEDAR